MNPPARANFQFSMLNAQCSMLNIQCSTSAPAWLKIINPALEVPLPKTQLKTSPQATPAAQTRRRISTSLCVLCVLCG
jgi:hypothetical protein